MKQRQLSDRDLLERTMAMLINAAEGTRSVADDRQYPKLRSQFSKRGIPLPPLLAAHPTIDSFMGVMSGIPNRLARAERVRKEFEDLILSTPDVGENHVVSSDWTGQPDRVAKLRVVRELLPTAQATIEALIFSLSEPGPNGGPLLDERVEAIDQLRRLHETLGSLLTEIDAGRFDDDLGQGLAADACRLAKTVRDNLRNDPLPSAVAGLVLGICTIAGHPTAGAFLSDATFRLSSRRKAR